MTAAEIRALRDALDLTQEELGAKVGVTGRTVSRWETGAAEPSRRARRQLERLTKQK